MEPRPRWPHFGRVSPARRPARSRDRRAPADAPAPYLNRELSWLDFNARVLHEARDERNPLLERVEVPGDLREQPRRVLPGPRRRPAPAGRGGLDDDRRRTAGRRPSSWPRSGPGSRSSSPSMRRSSRALRDELAEEGVAIVDYAAVPDHHERLRERFVDEIFPVLTPARRRSRPPVPVHQHAQPVDRGRHARPGDRRAPVRPGQGAPDPAPPRRGRAARRSC